MARAPLRGTPLLAALLLATATGSPAAAAETARGAIVLYECGDNCYLTIRPAAGDEIVGLCAAPECDPWNEVAEMPQDMVGRAVTVTIEMGEQVDGEGNVMGEFPSFTRIVFDK